MMSRRIGFLFGAGAEIGYGMPSGGRFALDIFRQDSQKGKDAIKKIRDSLDKSTAYATKWLPKNFDNNRIHVFGQQVFETIIKDTVGNNRRQIIDKINVLDEVAAAVIPVVNSIHGEDFDLRRTIEEELGKNITNINISQQIEYSSFFKEGNNLFANNYFAVLLEYYRSFNGFADENEKGELGAIIKAIFQLQIGAMSENISRTLEDNIFQKEELDLDIFDDLGGSLNVNYETAGVRGLELLSKNRVPKNEQPIITFAYEIIERIYADVLDYKSLIDSNWHYLYNPATEWAKFCRISTFLYTVQDYISEQAKNLRNTNQGYYDDLASYVCSGKISASVVATTNYSNFISNKLDSEVIFLNGGIDDYYDPYVNRIGTKDDLNANEIHFIVPLLFTQSGTKPMTSIDMSIKYVDFYNKLKNSDAICSIGFGFNYDDEHVNGIIRTLIDRDGKSLYIVAAQDEKTDVARRDELARKLKVIHTDRLYFIIVNKESRKREEKLWLDLL